MAWRTPADPDASPGSGLLTPPPGSAWRRDRETLKLGEGEVAPQPASFALPAGLRPVRARSAVPGAAVPPCRSGAGGDSRAVDAFAEAVAAAVWPRLEARLELHHDGCCPTARSDGAAEASVRAALAPLLGEVRALAEEVRELRQHCRGGGAPWMSEEGASDRSCPRPLLPRLLLPEHDTEVVVHEPPPPKHHSSTTVAVPLPPPSAPSVRSGLGLSVASAQESLRSLQRVRHLGSGQLDSAILNRAFVVNFRRLMELQKLFAVLHELIRSTAIAALTLVAAENKFQLCYSVVFVAILLVLYGFHAAHYDTMDIGDYRHIVNLLEDDDGACNGSTIQNPNRMLKALALSRRGRRRRASLFIFSFAVCCALMWVVVVALWTGHTDLFPMPIEFAGEFYPTLLLVGTLMLGFIIVFEWIYWRETQCVMPMYDKARRIAHNPQKHGVPSAYRWFGMPSMWFTSQDAYDDLRLWITCAQKKGSNRQGSAESCQKTALVSKIFPEEMALFALDAVGGCQLRNALLRSKLYGVNTGKFLVQTSSGTGVSGLRPIGKGENPVELQVHLLFFDNQTREYMEPEEGYMSGNVHLLQNFATSSMRSSEFG